MSVVDDLNRFAFERAKGKYNRAHYDAMSQDDWVALVEWYTDRIEELEGELAEARENAGLRFDE